MRPLEDALEAGNPIYAVIRGTGVSSDGRGGGHMMAPSREGQAQAMRDAYARAGVDPAEVQYVETHGTGTVIGDPVEIGALADVMGPGRAPDQPLRVASVKGNLGHAESASGVAGLINAALAIKHRELPAQMHFETPSPAIPWDEIPIRVQAEAEPWPYAGKALVGVNSFGISGTNAHVILESPPEVSVPGGRPAPGDAPDAPQRPFLIPLSAHEPRALEQMAERYRDAAREGRWESLSDLGYTLACRREQRPLRLNVVAGSAEELAEELDAYLDGGESGAIRVGTAQSGAKPELVMVFPGQGSQWLGMGRDLIAREPVFRSSIEAIDAAYARHVDWSLVELLEGRGDFDWRERLDVLQPLLVAVEVALAELWASWGVRPDRVIGQSMGEIAAARVAGCLSLEAMALLACERGRVVAQASGDGAMGVVALSVADLEPELAGFAGRVEVAGSNAPTTTLVSGDREAVVGLIDSLDSRGIFARRLEVAFASHCFHMDPLLDDFRARIGGLTSDAGAVSFVSTVDGEEKPGSALDTEYWVRNLRASVSFIAAIDVALEAGSPVFVEVSPHPTLARPIQEIAQLRGQTPACFGTLQREQDEQRSMLSSLAGLHAIGADVDLGALYPGGRVVETPLYAYQRKRYWFGDRNRAHSFRARHPLIGARRDSALDPRQSFWDITLDVDAAPYVEDYRIEGSPALPSSLYLELALAVADQLWPGVSMAPCGMEIRKPLALPADSRVALQLVLIREGPDRACFRILSRDPESGRWEPRARGRLEPRAEGAPEVGADLEPADEVESLTAASHFERLEAQGLAFGRRLRALKEASLAPAENDGVAETRTLTAHLMLPRICESEWFAYHAHPALVEGALQVLGEAFAPARALRCIEIDRVQLEGTLGSECRCRIRARGAPRGAESETGSIIADLDFFDREGRFVGRIEGLRASSLAAASQSATAQESDLYRVEWSPLELRPAESRSVVGRWILVSDSEQEARSLAVELEKKGDECFFCEKLEDIAPLAERLRRESPAPWGLALLGWADRSQPGQLEPDAHRSFRIASWSERLREHCADAAEVWIATRGQQRVLASDPLPGSSVAGLVADVEAVASFGELQQCRVFDASSALYHAERLRLADVMGIATPERQLAARGEELLVARLVPAGQSAEPAGIGSPDAVARPLREAGTRAYRAELEGLDGAGQVCFREIALPSQLSDDQVEVEVRAASLSALDVLTSLGLSRSESDDARELGRDFAGVVMAVGARVEGLAVGDRVMGLAEGAVSRRLVVPASHLVPAPAGLDLEEVAGLPLAYAVAAFVLEDLAGLRRGQKVLLRSGAGGIGLAAVAVARASGAEVYATASTAARRQALQERGAVLLHEDSAGEPGIRFDVILGAEEGHALHESLGWLRPGGRYVDLSPRHEFEIEAAGALSLAGNRTYSAFDLQALVGDEAPGMLAELLCRVSEGVSTGGWESLPAAVFPVSEAGRALRFMAQNRHVGRVTLAFDRADRVAIQPRAGSEPIFESDGGVLVAGSRPELQESIVEWLQERGVSAARSVASEDLDPAIAELEAADLPLLGIVHVDAAEGPIADALPRWIARESDGPLDLVALVSLRDAGAASGEDARAWETRTWIDRFLLAATEGRTAHAFGLSVPEGVEPSRVCRLLERAIQGEPQQGSVWVSIDPEELASRVASSGSPLFSALETAQEGGGAGDLLREQVLSLAVGERRRSMDRFVGDSLATVLSLGERDRAGLDLGRPLDELGLDSLMMMELFMGLSRELDLEIARDWFPTNPSVADVSAVLLEQLEEAALAAGA